LLTVIPIEPSATGASLANPQKNPLHDRYTAAGLLSDLEHSKALDSQLTDAVFHPGAHSGPANRIAAFRAFGFGPCETSVYPLLDHPALELCEHAREIPTQSLGSLAVRGRHQDQQQHPQPVRAAGAVLCRVVRAAGAGCVGAVTLAAACLFAVSQMVHPCVYIVPNHVPLRRLAFTFDWLMVVVMTLLARRGSCWIRRT